MMAPEPVMVGRAERIDQLVQLLQRGAAGAGGSVIVIEGEAGIGKSRLVQEALGRLPSEAVSVRAGIATELDRHRPFGPLTDALAIRRYAADPDRARIADQLMQPRADVDYSASEAPGEFRVIEAILALTERLCERSPTVLVVEDLHWSDPSTVACLARLARQSLRQPFVLLLTARPWPRERTLGALLRDLDTLDAIRIPLEPLTDADLSALVTATLGAPPGPNLRQQLRGVGGNPLLTVELSRALQEVAALRRHPDGHVDVELVVEGLSPRLTISNRLGFLPEDVVHLLRLATVLGATFSVADLCLLAGRTAAELSAPLDIALTSGMLEEDRDRLRFRHALIRECLYDDLPPTLRQALHRDMASALLAAGEPATKVGQHLLRGAAPGDRPALVALHATAVELAGPSPAVAAELLERARELIDPTDPLAPRIAADHAIALLWSGRDTDGEQACRRVLAAYPDLPRALELRLALIRSLLTRAKVEAAAREIEAAAPVPATPAQAASLAAMAAFTRLLAGDIEAALPAAAEAIRSAEACGDPAVLGEALRAAANAHQNAGDLVEATNLALRAVGLSQADPALAARPNNATAVAGYLLIMVDRADEGVSMLMHGVDRHQHLGARAGVAGHQVALGMGLVLTGDWDEAITALDATRGVTGPRPLWPVTSLGILALITVHRDRLDEAEEHLAAADEVLARGTAAAFRVEYLALARTHVLEAAGRPDEAVSTLEASWAHVVAGSVAIAQPLLGPELVRRLVAAGRFDEAQQVAEVVDGTARRNPGVASIVGASLVARGLAWGELDVLQDGVARLRTVRRPLELALACEDASRALAVEGRRDGAIALLEEARGCYAQLAAARCTFRVAASLRSLGVRPGKGGKRSRSQTGWDALTDTERKVAQLLALRLTNPEIAERMFISRRTVETHVSHILAKTGATSRLEVAREVLRRGQSADLQGAGEDR